MSNYLQDSTNLQNFPHGVSARKNVQDMFYPHLSPLHKHKKLFLKIYFVVEYLFVLSTKSNYSVQHVTQICIK
jgi:hypothetical protein